MRRLFVGVFGALALSFAIVGCSALLGLEEKPIDPAFLPDNEGGRADRRVDTLDGEQVGDTNNPQNPDAQIPLIPCLTRDGGKTQEPAYFCDDFETPSSRWSAVEVGVGAQVVDVDGNPPPDAGPEKTRALSGVRALGTGFAPTPATGDAYLRYQHKEGGPIAVRFAFELRNDVFTPATPYHVASMTPSNGQSIDLVFKANGGGEEGNLFLVVPGSAEIFVSAVFQWKWVCLEIIYDGTTVSAYADNAGPKGAVYAGKQINFVDLGYKAWVGTSNGNSRFNDFEDLIVSPARIGCN